MQLISPCIATEEHRALFQQCRPIWLFQKDLYLHRLYVFSLEVVEKDPVQLGGVSRFSLTSPVSWQVLEASWTLPAAVMSCSCHWILTELIGQMLKGGEEVTSVWRVLFCHLLGWQRCLGFVDTVIIIALTTECFVRSSAHLHVLCALGLLCPRHHKCQTRFFYRRMLA